jgi:hypothetical protein
MSPAIRAGAQRPLLRGRDNSFEMPRREPFLSSRRSWSVSASGERLGKNEEATQDRTGERNESNKPRKRQAIRPAAIRRGTTRMDKSIRPLRAKNARDQMQFPTRRTPSNETWGGFGTPGTIAKLTGGATRSTAICRRFMTWSLVGRRKAVKLIERAKLCVCEGCYLGHAKTSMPRLSAALRIRPRPTGEHGASGAGFSVTLRGTKMMPSRWLGLLSGKAASMNATRGMAGASGDLLQEGNQSGLFSTERHSCAGEPAFRRLGAVLRKTIFDIYAAMPSSWNTPRMAARSAS